jgi:hypothetical protein
MPALLISTSSPATAAGTMRIPREPRHIHVKGDDRDAKIWLEPEVAIAESYGFNSSELARILRIVAERRTLILKAWDDHFGNGRPF